MGRRAAARSAISARRPLTICMTSVLACLTAGCASLSGAPVPVISTATAVNLANAYPVDRAVAAFAQESDAARGGQTRQQYRDTVVSAYLAAIDARYAEFRGAISREGRGSALGLDLAVIGLTGTASVAAKSATQALSAAAGGFAGARAAIDKNLYFDRTLPALLAATDAERLRVLTRIMTGLRASPQDYPLSSAFADLANYQAAGSMDRAVGQVTAIAAADRQQAAAAYVDAITACDADDDLVPARSRISSFLLAVPAADTTTLPALAQAMGLSTTGDAPTLRRAIRRDIIANYCTNEKLAALIARVKATTWGSGI